MQYLFKYKYCYWRIIESRSAAYSKLLGKKVTIFMRLFEHGILPSISQISMYKLLIKKYYSLRIEWEY